jgi:hypothetical protein
VAERRVDGRRAGAGANMKGVVRAAGVDRQARPAATVGRSGDSTARCAGLWRWPGSKVRRLAGAVSAAAGPGPVGGDQRRDGLPCALRVGASGPPLVMLTQMVFSPLVALLRIDEMPVFVGGERCRRCCFASTPRETTKRPAFRSTGVEGQVGGATWSWRHIPASS